MHDFLEYSTNPLVLAIIVAAVAWLWEDASLVSGALLAAQGQLSVPVAVIAVFVGICSGDLALYGLGRLAHRWRGLRGWILTNPSSRMLSRRFRRRTMSNILLIRFVPGLRTMGFTLCGLWRVPLHRFLVAMMLAGVAWIAVIFTIVYRLGSSDWLENSPWKWALMGIALLLLILNNLWAHRRAKRVKTRAAASLSAAPLSPCEPPAEGK